VVLHVSDDLTEVAVSFEQELSVLSFGVSITFNSLRTGKLYRLPNQVCYDLIIEKPTFGERPRLLFKPICPIHRNAIRNQKRRGGSQFVSPVIDSEMPPPWLQL
jgi:hypothetical protein